MDLSSLSTKDREIYEVITDIGQKVFNVQGFWRTYNNDHLWIIFTDTKEVMGVDCELRIVFDTASRSITFVARLAQPVPKNKINDLYEALNDLNYKLAARMKMVLGNSTAQIEFRAEFDLFEDTFGPYYFERILLRFLLGGSVLLQVVERFVKGQAEKNEISKAVGDLDKIRSYRQSAPSDYPYPS